MMKTRVLVLAAMAGEAAAIARAVGVTQRVGKSVVMNGDVGVGLIGIRGCRLAEVLAGVEAQVIVIAGLGGALDPVLKVGDVVMSSNEGVAGVTVGGIYTSDTLVSSVAAKGDLFRRTGALVVDMETSVVQGVAAERGVKLVAIRGVSDTADEALDPALITWVDEVGKPRLSRVVAGICLRPGNLGALLRLKKASDFAMQNVAKVVAEVVEKEGK